MPNTFRTYMIFLMWKYKIVDKISTQTMQSAFDEGHWIKMYLIDKTGVESSNRPNKLLISIQHTYIGTKVCHCFT